MSIVAPTDSTSSCISIDLCEDILSNISISPLCRVFIRQSFTHFLNNSEVIPPSYIRVCSHKYDKIKK